MHSTAPPAIQVKVTPLRPVSGRPEPFLFLTVRVTVPLSTDGFITRSEPFLVALTLRLLFPSSLPKPSAVMVKVNLGNVL